jgi:adenosylhomocysteine nucleosidase
MSQPALESPKACHFGAVFALETESGCFEDMLEGVVAIRGDRFTVREGGLHGRRVVVVLSGAGQDAAGRATEVLIDGHAPGCVISAGFAGGLSGDLPRGAILIADRVYGAEGDGLPLELPGGLPAEILGQIARQEVRRGPLLTLDHVVRSPDQRRALFDRYGALAVDMETLAVARICRRRQVPLLAVRAIIDPWDEELPHEVEHLLVQKSMAGRLGAALRAIWRRPASVKDMYRLAENALVASDRLARYLSAVVDGLGIEDQGLAGSNPKL